MKKAIKVCNFELRYGVLFFQGCPIDMVGKKSFTIDPDNRVWEENPFRITLTKSLYFLGERTERQYQYEEEYPRVVIPRTGVSLQTRGRLWEIVLDHDGPIMSFKEYLASLNKSQKKALVKELFQMGFCVAKGYAKSTGIAFRRGGNRG